MSTLQEKLEKDINYLKKMGFDVAYSEKDRILIIERQTMLIHGLKNMLMGSRNGDAESYDIFEDNFIRNFKYFSFENSKCGFKVKSRYVDFNIKNYFGILENEDDIDKIRTTIGTLISAHIYNNFNYLEKQEKYKKLEKTILSI